MNEEGVDSRGEPLTRAGGGTARRAALEPPSAGPAAVVETGIAGLDDVLGGGLPVERLYVVEGHPGAGKTTLSLQFLLAGVARGERGLYVTLSETSEELEGVARSHGWQLDGLDLLDMSVAPPMSSVESQYTVFHPSEVELQDSVGALLDRVDRVRPTRVVLDSLSEMRLLARDPLRFRRQVLAFKQFFATRGVTVLMLDDLTADPRDMQLHSLAHGVIQLEQVALTHGAERRRLRVTKLRGVAYHSGFHDFAIRPGGLAVFPRLRLGQPARAVAAPSVKSGSPALDALLGGGISGGTSVLLTGAPGTGKSVLATQYAVAAAERGGRADLYLFDERVETFLERAAGLEMPLEPHLASGSLTVTALEPTEISPGELIARIQERLNDPRPGMVVIDSLSGFTKAMPQDGLLTIKLHELLSHLGGRGVTTLMTMPQHGIFGSPTDHDEDISYLADGVVLLRYFEARGEVRRAISVVKQRSSAHENTIREFRIGRGGLQVGEPLHGFHGVLLGVPTFTGGSTELLRDGSHASGE